MMPFGGGDDAETPPPATVAAAPAAAHVEEAQIYEIKNADRGLVRRVKVLLNGRTVATLVMSRDRASSSSYCCTADGCQETEVTAACHTLKMVCDRDGACARVGGEKGRL
jgi:hypothetical protein